MHILACSACHAHAAAESRTAHCASISTCMRRGRCTCSMSCSMHSRCMGAGCSSVLAHAQLAWAQWLAGIDYTTRTFRDLPCVTKNLQSFSMQGGSQSIAGFLEGAPPESYLIYLLGAGMGLPCSEVGSSILSTLTCINLPGSTRRVWRPFPENAQDAFVVWVGSRLSRGVYGSWQRATYVLAIVYAGVVISDLVRAGPAMHVINIAGALQDSYACCMQHFC